jgi:hypothetical protein
MFYLLVKDWRVAKKYDFLKRTSLEEQKKFNNRRQII